MNADIAKMKAGGHLVGAAVEVWIDGQQTDMWGNVTRLLGNNEVEIMGPGNRRDYAALKHLVPGGYAKQQAFLAEVAAEKAAR